MSAKYYAYVLWAISLVEFVSLEATAEPARTALEEVIVTAQKREQSLQDAPVAISTLSAQQLRAQNITSLQTLGEGAVPSLRVEPSSNSPTTLVIAIRGNGPSDVGQITRESSVGLYLDGIYLGRAHGLGMEVADLQRIEVLRGPQGTLFGRNAIGGAVSLISKKPTGQLHIEQTVGVGNYDALNTVTRIDLPEMGGLRAKFDYLHSQRDGWVVNSAPGQWDYAAYKRDGGRLNLAYAFDDQLSIDYSYDKSRVAATQQYYQLYIDNGGLIGNERDRESRTRDPATPLKPTVDNVQGHALTVAWQPSSELTVKSLTGYRKLIENTNANYGAAIYFNGLVVTDDVNQDQLSEELQLIGSAERFEWVGGLYYFRENARENLQNYFSLDTFGTIPGNLPNTPIIPATTLDLFSGTNVPLRDVKADTRSRAIYGQGTWTPPVLSDRLQLTVGLRYTRDAKSGSRQEGGLSEYRLDSSHTDPAVTVNYRWNDNLSTYAKWSGAYKSGGANSRSKDFNAYGQEEAHTVELGLKSEFFDNRARLNMAVFHSVDEHAQIDFSDPANISLSQTINAAHSVTVDGAEIDMTASPVAGLLVGISYTYLDADMPLQPNPLAGGQLEPFQVTQTPRHAGAVTLDYALEHWSFGQLQLHADATSTGPYAYVAKDFERFDGYTLLNARITLADMRVGDGRGAFKASVWGKNLTDEKYIVYAYPIGVPLLAVDQAFGDPRTAGIDLTYTF